MKKLPLLIIFFCTYSSAAQVLDNNCKSPKSGAGIIMMDEMRDKMRIKTDNIPAENITTELIYNEPVSDVLSEYYAKKTYESDSSLPTSKNKEIYSADNPRNLIIKFTFKNTDNKEDIFLVSTIANDYECGVRFNGYTIVKREF